MPICCVAGFAALALLATPIRAAAASADAPLVFAKDSAASPRKGPTPLRATYWKLVALDGKPARAFKDQREPHIILDATDSRVSGSGGCNNLLGSFTVDKEKLHFAQIAGTMMMCPEGMEQEAALVKALERVARYRIAGEALTLADDKGKAIAKFRAGPVR